MNKKELAEEIRFVVDETKVGAELFFHYENEGNSFLLKVPTHIDNLNKKIAKVYCKSVTELFSIEKEYEVLNLSEIREADPITTYYYYEENYPEALRVIMENSKEEYSYKKHEYKFIKGFVIKLSCGEEQITLYKVKNPLDFHVKPTTLTILRVENGFTSPSNEALILNDKFDYGLINKKLLVINLDQLERKFKFDERINLHSESIMNSLKENGKKIVEGFEAMADFLKDNRAFAKKMKPINYDGLLWKTDFAVIKDAVNKHDKLKKHLYFTESGDKFNIKSKVAARLFFSLCNDLVVISILSGNVATVHEKDEID